MQGRTKVVLSGMLAMVLAAIGMLSSGFAQGPGGQPDQGAQTDPPGRVARISVMQGDVSLEPAGAQGFAQAELNYPLTLGDRVYVDLQGLAELETAGLAVRMANGADVTLTSLTDQVAQFGLAQGSIRISTRDLTAPDGSTGVVEIDTPNGTIVVQAAGDVRVDSYPQNNTTVVTVNSGQVEVTGAGLTQVLDAKESVQLSGTNPVTVQFVGLLPPDALDQFDVAREGMYQSTIASADEYVSPDMIGAEDLEGYGTWTSDASYGAVWYPTGVAVGWTPYHNGHWVYIAPWGWTWVEAEPWGFAPFHYGRWGFFGGRWGWVPGPPPGIFQHPVRPYYSPALVAFVGGGPGLGVTAWFPLGPGEAFVPWYRTSAVYVNRVNVTNIYSRNAAQVRANYANRTTNIYVANTANVTYANRGAALTVVNQSDFAAGRQVTKSQPVRLDANTRQQLNQAPVVVRPAAAAPISAAVSLAPARVVPQKQERPELPARAAIGRGNNGSPEAAPARSTPAPIVRPSSPAPSAPQPRTYEPAPTEGAVAPRQPEQGQPETQPREQERQAEPAPRQQASPQPRQVEPQYRQQENQPAPRQQTQPPPRQNPPPPPKPAEPKKDTATPPK